jgi:hypothetical protein
MEYRSYSIYNGTLEPALIDIDANRVMQYLQEVNIHPENIIVCGRSIGCAFALSVVQNYKVMCSVLLSPFLSLKKVAQ